MHTLFKIRFFLAVVVLFVSTAMNASPILAKPSGRATTAITARGTTVLLVGVDRRPG